MESVLGISNMDTQSIWPSPVKFLVARAIENGTPVDTIVLLLLLPLVAAVVAAARHLIGLRGFGIFLPAALSFVFVAIGPLVGIGLFLVIVTVSTLSRLVLRKIKIKLQYLPRMSLILLLVVIGVLLVLLLVPRFLHLTELRFISIFPVLILILLAEDFNRVQLGKSARIAVSLTTETLILALISYSVLINRTVQGFALNSPEALLLIVLLVDIFLGKYSGLRFVEFWRFRKLIRS